MKKLLFEDWLADKLPKGIERFHRGHKKNWPCFKYGTSDGGKSNYEWFKSGAYDAWIYLRNVHGREMNKLEFEIHILKKRLGE